jgi:hypothetical protein
MLQEKKKIVMYRVNKNLTKTKEKSVLKLENKKGDIKEEKEVTDILKNEINELFAKNIKGTGKVIVLDHTDFKSTKALILQGVNKSRIIVPNNNHYTEMKNNVEFGECVINCSIQTLLVDLITKETSVSGVYADLMGPFTKEKSVLTQIKECNLEQDAVIGFTVCARGPNEGANFTNEYSVKLFKTNLIDSDAGVYVYGELQRMATCVYKK